MYDDCITCDKLGCSCDGPNFVAMSAVELLDWCKRRKQHLGLSRERLAEISGVPIGTINRLLSGTHYDFRYETLRPIIKVLVGGSFDGNPCPTPDILIKTIMDENARLKAELQQLSSPTQAFDDVARPSHRRHSRRPKY